MRLHDCAQCENCDGYKRDFCQYCEVAKGKVNQKSKKMSSERMDIITTMIKELIEEHGGLSYDDSDNAWELLSVIASLHNELYNMVHGHYYNYMYHWANLGWYGDVDEDLYKPKDDES